MSHLLQNLFVLYTNRENCILSTGFLVVAKVELTGLGGSMNVTFACNGCKLCELLWFSFC